MLEDVTLGMTSFGSSVSSSGSFRVSEDLILTDNVEITSIDLFGYQTNAPITPASINGVFLQIWDGNPSDAGSSVVWGDTTTNIIDFAVWSDTYRDSEGNAGSTARAIQVVKATTTGLSLAAGTYWLDWSLGGDVAFSGPWQPPIAILGQSLTGNALQFDGTSWMPLVDVDTVGLPFLVYGNVLSGNCFGDISEDFDAGLPAGWSTVINTGICDWENGTGLPTGDDFTTPGMFFNDDACGGGADASNVTLFSDVYDITSATLVTLSYDVAFQASTMNILETFTVEVYDGAAWQQVALYDVDLDPDIQTESIDVLAYANADFQVRWTYDDGGGEWGWHGGVDNFCMTVEYPTCANPTALEATNITETSADLGWTAGVDGETMWDAEWGVPGFAPGTGAEIGMVDDTTDNPYGVSSLSAETDYEFYVRAVCSGTLNSGWTGPFAFSTLQTPCTAVVTEDFEAGLPADWSTVVNTGLCDWENGADLPTGDDFATPGMFFNDDACGEGADASNVSLLSDVYDLTGSTFATLGYDVAFQVAGIQTFTVEVFDGAVWQQVAFYDADLDPNIQTESIDVLAYANADFQVRWTYDDNGGEWGWFGAMDNFCLDHDAAVSVADNTIEGFKFYPNPSSDVINLRALNNIDVVEVYNVMGQKVSSQSFNANQGVLNISNLSAGVYVMKVTASNEVASYQIIKK